MIKNIYNIKMQMRLKYIGFAKMHRIFKLTITDFLFGPLINKVYVIGMYDAFHRKQVTGNPTF